MQQVDRNICTLWYLPKYWSTVKQFIAAIGQAKPLKHIAAKLCTFQTTIINNIEIIMA